MRAPGARGPQRTRRETSGVPRTRLPGTRGGARPGVCGRRLLGASGTTRTPLLGLDGRSRGGSGSRARPCSGEPAGYGDRRVTAGHRLGHGVCAAAPGTEQSRAPPDGAMRKARGGARRARTAGRASEGAGGGSGRAGRGARPRGPGSCLVLWHRESAKGARRGGDKGTARHVHLQRPGRRAHGRS